MNGPLPTEDAGGSGGDLVPPGTGGTGGVILEPPGTGGSGGSPMVGSGGSSGSGGMPGSGGTTGSGGMVMDTAPPPPDVSGSGGMIVDTGAPDRGNPGSGGSGSGSGGAPATDRCPATRWMIAANTLCDTDSCASIATGRKAPASAIDGDPATRYTSGRPQGSEGAETIAITFPGNVSISGFRLLNTSTGDGPAQYRAEFAVAAGGAFAAFHIPVTGAGSDDLTVTFPEPTTMRALRITQTGTKSVNWWSIHELTVQGCVNAN